MKCVISVLTLLLSTILSIVEVAQQARELASRNIITYFQLFNIVSLDSLKYVSKSNTPRLYSKC